MPRSLKFPATFLSLALFSFAASAQTFLTLNAEWFWDELPPHEGAIAPNKEGFPPTAASVEARAKSIAALVELTQSDIVALAEIENDAVARRFHAYLSDDWTVVFLEGRDTYTGQDVVILTRLSVIDGTTSTFPNITGRYNGVEKTPSKMLGVGLTDGTETYFVLAAHLLSKWNNSPAKDYARAAQANALRQIADSATARYDHVIVMGDLNDVLGSITLKQLLDDPCDSSARSLVRQPDKDPKANSTIDGYNEAIDHILVSRELASQCGYNEVVDVGDLSDHNAVVLRCGLGLKN